MTLLWAILLACAGFFCMAMDFKFNHVPGHSIWLWASFFCFAAIFTL